MVNVCEPSQLPASLASTVKVNEPVAVGMPVIVPSALSVSPVGNVAGAVVSAKVYGDEPPVAVKLWPVYATLNVPFGNVPPPVRVTVITGQVTVSVATFVVAVPHVFVNTARYWLPFWDRSVVNVSVVVVSPGMSVKLAPASVETCHCTVGVGEPLAAAVKVAELPDCTDCVSGCVVTA